jgi:hypothetical protein
MRRIGGVMLTVTGFLACPCLSPDHYPAAAGFVARWNGSGQFFDP